MPANRPNPHPQARLHCLILMLVIAMLTVQVVSGQTQTEIYDTRYEFKKIDLAKTATNEIPVYPTLIYIRDFDTIDSLQTIFYRPAADATNFILYNETIKTQTKPVYFRSGTTSSGAIVGTGTYTYFKGDTTAQSHIRIDVNTYDKSVTTSNSLFIDFLGDTCNLKSINGPSNQPGANFYLRGTSLTYAGAYQIEYYSNFLNTFTLTDYNADNYKLAYSRGGVNLYDSQIVIYDKNGNTLLTNSGVSSSYIYVNKDAEPYTIQVYSTNYQKGYTTHLGDGEPWFPPTVEPTPTPTTTPAPAFDFSISPDTPTVGTPVTATVVGPLDSAGIIAYVWGDTAYWTSGGSGSIGDYEVVMLKREDSGSDWYRDDGTGNYTIPVLNPATHTFEGPTHTGVYKLAGMVKGFNGKVLHLQDIYKNVGGAAGYNFVVPNSGAAGMGLGAFLECSDGDLDRANIIFYTLSDNTPDGYYAWSGFKKIAGQWYQNDATDAFTIPVGDPRGYTFPPLPHGGNFRFNGIIKDDSGAIIFSQEIPVSVSEGTADRSPVTVRIQDSQTGALLSGSRLVISESYGIPDYLVEVVNTTLPGGSGQYNLRHTVDFNPLYYLITAIAPGYNQQSPLQNFEVTGAKTVIVLMDPISGGPTDPEKTYVEFYVTDGNNNPVSGALITVNGTFRQANSQGYVQYELAKLTEHTYKVSKFGYYDVTGTFTPDDSERYRVNVKLSKVTPTTPGATPTPDTRSPAEKAASGLDYLLDNAENFGIMAGMILLIYMSFWMVPKRR